MQRGKIRPPKRSLRPEADEFDQCWAVLREALTDIHNRNAGRLSFEHLYRASYKIVLKKHGERLYDLVKEFERDWFAKQVIPQIQALIAPNLVNIIVFEVPGTSAHERREMGDTFLRGLKDAWESHNMSMNMVADILMYLDKGWLKESKNTSIFVTTIGLFRDHLLDPGTISAPGYDRTFSIWEILCAVILDHVNMEREGDVVDRNLIHRCVTMLEDLYETDDELDSQRLYLTYFELPFLESSRKFYRAEALRLLRGADASVWLRHTHRRLREEADRCRTTLSRLTTDKISKVVEAELISTHLSELLALESNGLKSMLDNDRIEDLAILYELILKVDPTTEALKNGLQNRITAQGAEIEKSLRDMDNNPAAADTAAAADGDTKVEGESSKSGAKAAAQQQPLSTQAQQTAAAIKWVDDVLALRDKYDTLWERCFEQDLAIQSAITKGFSDFIHAFPRSSEYVSLFIDDNLKRGIRGKTDGEVGVILDKAIVLIRYLRDKDLFERYYQKHLARRLLHSKSGSEEVEKQMISLMQLDLGKHFTSKFEGMFKDMATSEELSKKYHEHISSLGDDAGYRQAKPIELSVSVLTSNNWPPEVMGRTQQLADSATNPAGGGSTECIYPPEVKRLQESFFKFYLRDRSGRVLTWVGSAGTADIKCVFPRVPGRETGPLSKERRYELGASTYGMVVLLLFNDVADGASLSLEDVQASTNIPPKELSRALASLSINPKARVLLKDPPTKTIRPGDRFSFNTGFVSKAIKIKAPVISSHSKVEGDEERQKTEDKNDETRRHMVDAAIVRIMKSRKELAHNSLLTEVISQLASRFQPQVPMIKARIEDLIGREYLERIEDSAATNPAYRYLA
ncbi:Cullin-3 [Gaeumannomyces tritici R3-111a-1]|uniref:Cullin-3 n=1 Tax=Gaeumannomyces tritici (strain R3-111a-1) TaxID=644352 RepID=J3P763_GAET3|nr:Cullin-3 [Gaeumannomyces tritici R3-111a-1]EJT72494.1 Cullin-3 [Gaeumannomyces tritici R3-111a-1]